jgi:predicted Zn finger-like uncharacterized protein
MTGAVSTLAEALKLFTQCSKCETVFKLSAEVLRAAGGQVRCGKCGEVFSALARLAEDSSAFSAGESALDLEARAYSILETVVAPQVAHEVAKDYEEFAAPGIEIARLEILDIDELQDGDALERDALDSERSLEFTLPPGELDRIFIESKKRASTPQPAATSPPAAASPPAARSSPPTAASPPPPRPQPTLVPQPTPEQRTAQPRPVPPEPLMESEPAVETLLEPDADSEPPRHPESVAANGAYARNRTVGFEVPEDVRRDMLAEFEQHVGTAGLLRNSARDSARNSARGNAQRRALILWLGAAVVSALLLAAQVMHQDREWLAAHAHGPVGAVLRALYGALGAPLPAPGNLTAYELRQWGVTGDPDANGTLRVRASILNTAAQLQPYPLLRVTLADRFGKNIGRRDFEPSEYLGRPTAKLLTPGERVDATLAILDPGKEAEGFEIDVCLRGADQRISCANDVAPQARR